MSFLKKEHDLTITSREKEVTTLLLNYYGIDHLSLSFPGKNMTGLLKELVIRNRELIALHRREKFDLAFGTSVSIAHLSALFGIKSYNFCEDDDSVIPLQSFITYPFTTTIINPDCIKYNRWRSKRVFHSSYHELAYLHPENFTPCPEVLDMYGLKLRKYIIIRLSALDAHHDWGKKGISSSIYKKIKNLLTEYDLVESVENKISFQFKHWHMHDLIAYAKMVISDSQTTTAEAAVLGVPSIRYNSFVGKISYLEELEHKYSLTFGFRPGYDDEMIDKINELLNQKNIHEEWQKRRMKMLSKKVDLNQWMISYFNKLN
jgi:hypothetical protein|tara:strand:- start:593 stop:1546 length:954 start_codon:yes stop_codon:yes gene_type:complete